MRPKNNYDTSPKRISGAVWRDPLDTAEWRNEIPRDRKVVIYCVSGGWVSKEIAERFRKSHGDAHSLEGGIKAWEELGEPVE